MPPTTPDRASEARLRRLAEELEESGCPLDGPEPWRALVLHEIDHALRPPVFERHVPSHGSIVEPSTDPLGWERDTQLAIQQVPIGDHPLTSARRFADGLSSWIVRTVADGDHWAVFDRPAGSERDLVVLSESLGATIVQRHPVGAVRVVGPFGVLRWEGLTWRLEAPVARWVGDITAGAPADHAAVLSAALEFAVHDLGARGIGAILVVRSDEGATSHDAIEHRLPHPPALQLRRPSALAPLRHALRQVDGAAIFDSTGTLRHLGTRLVPSTTAEEEVAGYRGMRHTAASRYSFDDPDVTVIVVSEDGPVSVLRAGELIGTSRA